MVKLTDFKVSHYPDGHNHVVSNVDLKGSNVLEASIRNFDDLFLIAQIKAIHPELTCLQVNYMLAGRCDRRFSPGEAVDLKIVCDFINRLHFESVIVLQPHSYHTIQMLKNASKYNITPDLIRLCLKDIGIDNVLFIAPDVGARDWVKQDLDRMFGFEYSMMSLSKKRDASGAVAGISIPRLKSDKLEERKKFVIVDDLCDGGGTFTAIARELKLISPEAKVYLVVTHAIFSKGFTPFEGLIEHIYCTNSFADFENPLVTQIKL